MACVGVTSLKKKLQHRCLPVNIERFLKNSFSQNTSVYTFFFWKRFVPVLYNDFITHFKDFQKVIMEFNGNLNIISFPN